MGIKVIDLKGQVFGRLTVGDQRGFNKHGLAMWVCSCVCGKQIIIAGSNLRRHHSGRYRKSQGTKSCGCFRSDAARVANTKHGMFGTRLYSIWSGMIQRCENRKHIAYKRYGGRGIKICKAWRNFDGFHKWAISSGYSRHLTIDREDNNKGYCPSNCGWETQKTQGNNKRNNINLTFNGRTQTLAQWSEELKIHKATLDWRIRAGWSTTRALSDQIRGRA